MAEHPDHSPEPDSLELASDDVGREILPRLEEREISQAAAI